MLRVMTVLIFALLIAPLAAQTAEEIIQNAEDAIKGSSAHGTMEMTIVTPDYTRTMKMESWWVGNEKALIRIEAPKKEAGNKTLKIGTEMWNYLKNTETTIKIPPSMMLQSWNGSDFTNDDLVRESNLNEDYAQALLGTEEVDGQVCWKVQLTPRPEAPVVWGKLFYWVRQRDYLPARVDYYDEKGEVGNRIVPTRWSMHNEKKEGRFTEFRILSMQFNINIPERIFSFRELERGD